MNNGIDAVVMMKWEYAAIVRYDIPLKEIVPDTHGNSNFKGGRHTMWALVQPGKDLHLIMNNPVKKGQKPQTWEGMKKFVKIAYAWGQPQATRDTLETVKSFNDNNVKTHTKWNVNKGSMPVILYESDDILRLVNMAGAEGWEITDSLGDSDLMRREL